MLKQKSKSLNPKDFEYLYDNVLVVPIVIDEVGNGLVRPQGYEDKPEIGEVVKVGEGRIFDNGVVVPLKVKVGDIVYFNKYSSVKIRLDTTDYLILKEEDLQGFYRGK